MFGISIGIIIGVTFIKFIEPIITIKLDVYQYKQTNIANEYNLEAQRNTMQFYRDFPEAKNEQNQELSPCIGYKMSSTLESEEDFEDKKIGFQFQK
jgi:hypothetical protein